MDRYWYFLL